MRQGLRRQEKQSKTIKPRLLQACQSDRTGAVCTRSLSLSQQQQTLQMRLCPCMCVYIKQGGGGGGGVRLIVALIPGTPLLSLIPAALGCVCGCGPVFSWNQAKLRALKMINAKFK